MNACIQCMGKIMSHFDWDDKQLVRFLGLDKTGISELCHLFANAV